MRTAVITAAACLSLIGLSHAQHAHSSIRKSTNIHAQKLGPALRQLAKDHSFQILVRSELVRHLDTPGASGELTTDEALTQLLSGTALSYRYIDDKTVTVVPIAGPEQVGSGAAARRAPGAARFNDPNSGAEMPYSRQFRLAQNEPGAAPQSQAQDASAPASNTERSAPPGSSRLEEVIVTAQKREERLQDVPVPVTAISADALAEQNLLRARDYFSRMPGLSLTTTDYTGGDIKISIRGLSTGGSGYGTNPTVGVVVDDVPYGASTGIGGGALLPDLDPTELARIEVLRGPQGTLYGANSIGGLLKFVTVDPSTEALNGRVQAGVSSVSNGDEPGYNVRGSVNVPFGETFAIRASGFTRRDPGYIDNVLTGEDAVNSADVDGGRLSALWRPSESFALKLSALMQQTERHGEDDVHHLPGLGELEQRVWPRAGEHKAENEAYSANVTARLGGVDLTILSGYNTNSFDTNFDGTATFWCIGFAQSIFGVDGCPWLAESKTEKFSQEVRLSGSIGERNEWLLGAFYTDEDVGTREFQSAADSAGAIAGLIYDLAFDSTYREYAAFAGFTHHFTDRFNIQIGGRGSDLKQSFAAVWEGPFLTAIGAPNPSVFPKNVTKDDAYTYLVTPQFKASEDLMLYARLASGFRTGGPNFLPALGTPPSFGPDKTRNYEIGVKGNALNGLLSFDASVFYIDWEDLQVYMLNTTTGSGFFDNTGSAKSEGVELSVDVVPWDGLKAAAWIVWNQAELTEDFPANSVASGAKGDRLPFSTRFSGSASLEQEFPLTGNVTGFVGGSFSYIGKRFDVFAAGPERQRLPSYTQTDLRAGVEYDTWAVNLHFNNVTDERGIISGGIGNLTAYGFRYIQPRTVGLTVSKTF